MVRLVDAATALEALDPDPEIETAFSLSVSDPLVDWNDETFRVAVADGTVAVEPTVDGEVDKSEVDGAEAADAAIDIGTLSQLYVGYTSVDEAVRSDGLAVGSALADDDSRGVPAADDAPSRGVLIPQPKAPAGLFIRGPPTTRHEFPRRPTRRRPRGAARRA